MASYPSKPSYSHGSTGSEPASSIDYANGDPLDANHFDYFVHTEFDYIKDIIDTFAAIDSNSDGVVDKADLAADAETAQLYKNNDIDSDGDGVVDDADHAAQADNTPSVDGNRVYIQSSAPSSPSDGDIWVDTS